MNGLALYAGGGAGELAFKHILPEYRTVGYVDNDKYCQAVIRARIRDGVLDGAPIFDDIRDFNARYATLYAGKVDWLSAGFPCQPFSVAGRQLGEADERNMWPATRDAISIIRPGYVFLENVPALISGGYLTTILSDITKIGYDCEWDVVSAADVAAPHLRKRLWILAYSNSWGQQVSAQLNSQPQDNSTNGDSCWRYSDGCGDKMADANGQGFGPEGTASQEILESEEEQRYAGCFGGYWNCWTVEPDVGRVAHGVAHRVDRLKALGNGWVIQCLARILQVGGE